MFIYSYIFVSKSGECRLFDQTPLKPSAELRNAKRVNQCACLSKGGWHSGEFGYLHYVIFDRIGNKYVFPYIYCIDSNRPTKRFPDHSPFLTKQDFERYVATVIDFVDATHDSFEQEFEMLVHDLRRLSTSIYNAAEEAMEALRNKDYTETRHKLKNVISAQGILRVRTDVLDFQSSFPQSLQSSQVPVYRRIHKVVMSFTPTAKREKKSIIISGRSFSTALGPDNIEIVGYLIIENAIKYSLSNEQIRVEFDESASEISFSVSSFSVQIDDQEVDRIFEKGYRSKEATKAIISGTGLGLYLAKEIIDRFSGVILLERDYSENLSLRDINYGRNTFVIRVPISKKDTRPRAER